jgi:iron complex outermembrane receptor protein
VIFRPLLLASAMAAAPAANDRDGEPASGSGAAESTRTASAAAGSRPPSAPAATHREETWVVAERRPLAADRSAAAVSTLDGDRLRQLPVTSAAEAVAHLPGFHVLFASPFGGPPMEIARGFFGGGEAGYVQLRVDGAPVADVESGGAPWAAWPADSVERVEALRGPASPLYGDAALGGVVDVVTVRASDRKTFVAGGALGSFHTDELDRRAHLPAGPVFGALDMERRRTRGYRRHGREEHFDLGMRLRAREAKYDEWTLAMTIGEEERQDPGPLPLAAIDDDPAASDPLFARDHRNDERKRGVASWQHGATLARGWGEDRKANGLRTLLVAAGFGDSSWRELTARTRGVSAESSGGIGRGDALGWQAGIEAVRERLDSEHFAMTSDGGRGARLGVADGARLRLGGFVAASFEQPRWRLTAALRRDDIRDDFAAESRHRAWSPRVGFSLSPRAASPLVLFAHAAEAFKAPTLDQLFDQRPFPDGAGGSLTLSNPLLQPQRARTVEAGARGFGPGASWQVALYRTAVEDEIDFDPATFRYVNIGSSLHRGVELGGDLWRGELWGHAGGRVGAAWEWSEVFARQGENAGRQLKNIPEHTLRFHADAKLSRSVEAGLVARHLVGRHLDDAQRFPLGDPTLVDMRLRRTFGRWEVRLDVWNLLDERFLWVGYALPDFVGGVVPYAFPGHPRSGMLAVRWRDLRD